MTLAQLRKALDLLEQLEDVYEEGVEFAVYELAKKQHFAPLKKKLTDQLRVQEGRMIKEQQSDRTNPNAGNHLKTKRLAQSKRALL